MATKKTDTDNTTRTTADNTVNTPKTDVVNKVENKSDQGAETEASMVVYTISAQGSDVQKGFSGEDADFVPEGTKLTPLELLEQAHAVAAKFDNRNAGESARRKRYSDDSKIEGRNVIKRMLLFVESFKRADGRVDEDVLSSFLDEHVGEVHAGATTPYHRISKHCSTSDTAKVLISKQAFVLTVLVNKNIDSSELDERFEKKEKIGPNNLARSGMQKYLLIYEIEHLPPKDPLKKYENFTDDRLAGDAVNLMAVLLKRHLLPDSLVAEAKKQLEAATQKAE